MIEKFKKGNALIYTNPDGTRLLFIVSGLSFKVIIIDANEFIEDSDEWINKKIEDYLIIKQHK